MTRRERIVAWVLLSFILVLTFVSFGTESIGWPKVGGLSMEPTIHQPLYWPFGDPSVRHRGAYVHVSTQLEPIPGSIVMFRHGEDRDIKRVEKARADGALWVMADNVGVTGMDSREYGWIPATDIVGVVDRIATPQRLVRMFTAEGRFRNRIESLYPPKCTSWQPDSLLLTVNGVKKYALDGTLLGQLPGKILASGVFVPDQPSPGGGHSWSEICPRR